MDMLVSRRGLLQRTGQLAAGASLVGIGSWMQPAHGQASETYWVEAVRAVDRVFDVLDSFIDNGMFYLRSMQANQVSAVASQMDALLKAIAEAQAKVQQVNDADNDLVMVQFRPDVFGEILDVAGQYRSRIAGQATALDMPAIRSRIAAQREVLANSPPGIGPETVPILALAFGAELGAATREGADAAEIRAIVERYVFWAAQMRSERTGSIGFRLRLAEMTHDTRLNEVAQTHLGRRLGIPNFVLSGNQTGAKTMNPCVIFRKGHVPIPPLDGRGGLVMPESLATQIANPASTSNIIHQESSTYLKSHRDLSVRIIGFMKGSRWRVAAPTPDYFPALANQYCYLSRSDSAMDLPRSEETAGRLPGVKEDVEAHEKILAAISAANAARLLIAICGVALARLRDLESKINRPLEFPTQ